jgi:hypothetical protein
MAVEYKGWDFAELLEVLGIEEDKEQSSICSGHSFEYQKEIGNRLSAHLLLDIAEFDDEGKAIVAEMRSFLNALITWDDYKCPLWIGLSGIEHDWTFATMFIELMPFMWN